MVFESRIIGFQHLKENKDQGKKAKYMFFTAKPINSSYGCGLSFDSNSKGGFNSDIYFIDDNILGSENIAKLDKFDTSSLLDHVVLLVGSKDYGLDHFEYDIKEL